MRKIGMTKWKGQLTAASLLLGAISIAPACSNEEDSDSDSDSDARSDSDSDSDSDADAGDGDGDTGDGDGDGDTGDGDGDGDGTPDIAQEFETCAAEAREAESLPADILFMIDQSISMTDHTVPDNQDGAPTRWKVLRDAIIEFVEDEGSSGLRVGLDFFPQPGDWMYPATDTQPAANSQVSCDVEDYMSPEVTIAELPGNSEDLVDAYPAQPNGGFTTSHAALEGALTYARDWAGQAENAGRGIAVVWVTDGFPTACDDQTISGLAALAESFNNPEGDEIRVPTFVVGLGPVANLEVVARAGGTGDGYFVAETAVVDPDAPDPVDQLLSALRRVANSPTLCEFDFPVASDGSPLDPEKVNVQFTPLGGTPEAVFQTDGPGSCSTSPGWYYDDPADPTTIEVCPSVCGNFGGGTVSIVAGCATVPIF